MCLFYTWTIFKTEAKMMQSTTTTTTTFHGSRKSRNCCSQTGSPSLSRPTSHSHSHKCYEDNHHNIMSTKTVKDNEDDNGLFISERRRRRHVITKNKNSEEEEGDGGGNGAFNLRRTINTTTFPHSFLSLSRHIRRDRTNNHNSSHYHHRNYHQNKILQHAKDPQPHSHDNHHRHNISFLTLLSTSSLLLISIFSALTFTQGVSGQMMVVTTTTLPTTATASAFGQTGNSASASGRNINSGIFSPNNFAATSSVSSSGGGGFPITSSGGTSGSTNTLYDSSSNANTHSSSSSSTPTSSSSSSSLQSRPTAYFIAGLASQIRKINSTAMNLLTKDKPFQLQFRTVCPFGNIVYDDKFAISINSGGNMTYSTRPGEFPSVISRHSVADGRWHSISFNGAVISLDDAHDHLDPTYREEPVIPAVHWDTNSSSENGTSSDDMMGHNHFENQMLQFFDGFVGCIRVLAPDNNGVGTGKTKVQSYDENYYPESEHQIGLLHDLFQLRTPFAPCNDTDVDLTSIHSCFNPESFLLCSKCVNGGTCRPDPTTDNPMNNQCECPPNTEEIEYSGKYCEFPPPVPGSGFGPAMGPGDGFFGHGHEGQYSSESEPDDFEDGVGSGGLPILSSPSNLDSISSSSGNGSEFITRDSSSLGGGIGRHANMQLSPNDNIVTISTTTTTEPPPVEIPFAWHSSGGEDCPCHNGGRCTPSTTTQDQYFCNCSHNRLTGKPAWTGQYCDTDVEECLKYPHICNNGVCFNNNGGFGCFCTPGWTGKRCDKNFDDCLVKPCKNNGTCHDLIDEYRCECQPGFTGVDCEVEINECDSNPCQNDGLCTDKLNDYECECQPGFEGKSCETDINECDPKPCLNGGKCQDKVNGFVCDCLDTGFVGETCQINVDDCRPDSCKHNGTCEDLVKGYNCKCHAGFSGNDCEIDEDECDPSLSPCLNGGQCFQRSNQSLYESHVDQGIRTLLPEHFSYETASGYVCLCNPGFDGRSCENNIDECALQASPCGKNGNCKDEINSFRCECHAGFTGERCEIDINECDSSPCAKGDCYDRVADYECKCPDGYGAKNCGVLLTGCVRDPCNKVGFAKCLAFYDEATNNHTFECECKEGWTGRTCSLQTVMSFNGSGPVEVTANDRHYDNGNYELHFKFRTTLPDVLLVVGSGFTYFYLTLAGGKLNLQSSLLNSLEGISVGQNLSNSELHKVWISVNATHIALAADSQQTFYPIQAPEDVPTGFNVTYIGGGRTNAFVNNPTKTAFKSQFIGCMQDIILNGEKELVIPEYLNSSTIEVGCKRTDQCRPNPCQNKGNCTDLWQNFTCKCLRPYLGERCQHEYIAATFQHESQNDSLAWVEIPSEISNKFISTFDISMFVRTRKRNGTIFVLGNYNGANYSVYLEAEVGEVGNLVVHAKWFDSMEDGGNSKVEVYAVDGLQITDGYPHLLSIQREKGLVKISVNGTEHFRKSVGNKISFNPTRLYLGGKPVFGPLEIGSEAAEGVPRVRRGLEAETTANGGGEQLNEEVEDPFDEDSSTSTHDTIIPLSSNTNLTYIPQQPQLIVDNVVSPVNGTLRNSIAPLQASLEESMDNSETLETEEYTEVHPSLMVANPFKGVIQDVRVNFSSNEVIPMSIIGHSHLSQLHAKTQNHYVVEFYPLMINSTYAMGEPLGLVEKQNIVNGTVSDDACKVNQCLNGGECETTWNDFVCNCTEEFDGALCEHKLPCAIMTCPGNSRCRNIGWTGFECLAEAAFKGRPGESPHYQLVSNEIENVTLGDIAFSFRTKSTGSIIYIANGTNSLRIALESESLDAQNHSVDGISFYIDGVKHASKGKNWFDGRWHSVSTKIVLAEKDSLRMRLMVDGKEYKVLPPIELSQTAILEFVNDLVKSPNVDIVVGSNVEQRDRYHMDHPAIAENAVGHPEDAHVAFYRGCLNDVRLGPFTLPFVTTSELLALNPENSTLARHTAPTAFYIVESSLPKTLRLGCVVCYDDECRHDGYCDTPEESFDCTCRDGFEGQFCQVDIDECDRHDCQHGATCVDGIANYTCNCAPGFTGWRCDEDIDECALEPCKNGGTCHDMIASYSCSCTDEYLGHNCEKRKRSSCKDDPCENGATCYDRKPHYSTDVTFECKCAPGFEGDTCSIEIDYCKNIYCMNGGTCLNKPHGLGYECMCVLGFDGPLCEVNINDCSPNPCSHNGTCEDLVNGFQCHCEGTGYDGQRCEEDINECIQYQRVCPRAQECRNLDGSYDCFCQDEYMCGDNCNIVNPCYNQTCYNGGECRSVCHSDDDTEWICDCKDNYEGKLCQLLVMAPPGHSFDILLIIIPIIAAFLIAATIGVVILVRMARRKRATRGVYSPSQQEYCNPRVELDNVMKPPPEERLI